MIIPITGSYRWTGSFDQPRPLTAEKKTHIHGAEDLASGPGAKILAPEAGRLYCFCAIRPDTKRSLGELASVGWAFDFLGRPYFYDVYGGVLIIVSKDGSRTHLLTHSYRNQIFNEVGIRPIVQESPKDERFPICAEHTFHNGGREVREGQEICGVGNAGFSTGHHIHWEIHHGQQWTEYHLRPRPRSMV